MNRNRLALLVQLAGFTALAAGVYFVFGIGVALIVAGVLLVGLGR